jgi:GT2 family glycosyltransferase
MRSPDIIRNHQIIVVDNNSTDNSVPSIKRLANKFPEINLKVIANNKNLGFATANNQAIKDADSEFILLLNSDTLVQAGALAKLLSSMNSSSYSSYKIGLLAATLLNWDGTHQPQGGDLPNLFTLICQQFFIDDIPIVGKLVPSIQKTGRSARNLDLNSQEVSDKVIFKGWVGATALLIRKSLLDEVGDLDENIFMYGEDVEFCLRAKNHHWLVAQHLGARITHFQSASSSPKNAIVGEIKGILYIWSKHKPVWQYRIARTILLVGSSSRILVYRLLNNKEKVSAYQEAINYLQKK